MDEQQLEIISKLIAEPKAAIMLIGIHATGKTTFYNMYMKNLAQVSFDEKSRRREQQAILNLVEQGISFVIDSNNITKKDRRRIFDTLKGKGYKIIGLYFCSVTRECIERNRKRGYSIPDKKIIDMAKIVELPINTEGFSDIYYVDNIEDEFSIENWIS